MDKDPSKMRENKSPSVPPKALIKDVIQSLETIDRKMEEFYAIHGTDLHMGRDNPPNTRRMK